MLTEEEVFGENDVPKISGSFNYGVVLAYRTNNQHDARVPQQNVNLCFSTAVEKVTQGMLGVISENSDLIVRLRNPRQGSESSQ